MITNSARGQHHWISRALPIVHASGCRSRFQGGRGDGRRESRRRRSSGRGGPHFHGRRVDRHRRDSGRYVGRSGRRISGSPATFCGLEALGCVRTMAAAAMMAKPPSPAERRVSRCVRMDYLQQPTGSLTSDRRLLIRRTSRIGQERFFELRVRFYVEECSQSIARRPSKWT
jgi:hypothetical protein